MNNMLIDSPCCQVDFMGMPPVFFARLDYSGQLLAQRIKYTIHVC